MKSFTIEIPKGYKIDKEKSTFENIVFKPITEEPTEYVDLGLPSGTLWAIDNENGYYSYQDAIDTFGKNNLPKLTDFAELYDYCKWTWDNKSKSMIVTGPNGKYIILPASGYYNRQYNELNFVGYYGYYWSATPCDDCAYFLDFSYYGSVTPSGSNYRVGRFAIRKIKRK